MSNPQDDNIVPFPQRFQPATSPEQRTEDTILSHTNPIPDDHPIAPVRHIRAMPLGLSTGAFYPFLNTENAIDAAAKLDVHTVEVMLQTRSEYTPAFARKLNRHARNSGVNIYSVHTRSAEHRMPDVYERRMNDSRAQFRMALDLAVEVGAKVLVWHGADRQSNAAGTWEGFVRLVHELHDEFVQAGVILGIENVSYGHLCDVRSVTLFAPEVVGRPNLGFVFDPFQAVEARANPFMMLAAMGNRIVDVHLSDARESNHQLRHLPPGDGDLPWSALIRGVANSGYSGPLIIESVVGTDDTIMKRVRSHLEPLFRSVFDFPPGGVDEHRPLLDSDDWRQRTEPPVGVIRGIELFNQREFYQQHEEIEHEWHAEPGPLRRLYQGLLQIGVGFYHVQNANFSGAETKLQAGIEKVSAFAPQALGIDTARLAHEASTALLKLQELGAERVSEFDQALIPSIHFVQPKP